MTVKVLAYHQVNNMVSDPLTVKTEMFLRQLDYLEDKGFNFISPREIPALANNKNNILLTFDDGYKDTYEVVYPLLKAKGIPAIVFITYNFLGQDRMLAWEELKILSSHGLIIGAHTLSHPRLTRLSRGEARKEIADSRHLLAELLNREVEYFCYPYGDLNEEIVELVKEAGYKAAFVTPTRWGLKEGPFTLKRCGIYHHNSFPVFKFKLTSLYGTLRYGRG